MRFICVKWGDKYSAEWVWRLKAAIAYWYKSEYEFVCMTDDPTGLDGIDCVPCADGLPTWWSKVALFQPGMFPGKNIYLDLDVVLTGPITLLRTMFVDGCVVAPDDFSYSLINPKQGLGDTMQRFLGGPGTINSSVMLWEDDAGLDVWEKFTPDKMDEVHGDQNWITQALWPKKLALLPAGMVCSFKYHVQRNLPTTPIVVFHGDPKPDTLGRYDPLAKAWRGEH